MTDKPSFRYDNFGNYIPLCQDCGQDMYPHCLHCQFPRFTMLSGMRMLAAGLLAHYGIIRDWNDPAVAELENIIGDELLDIGREFLKEKGFTEEAEKGSGLFPSPGKPASWP